MRRDPRVDPRAGDVLLSEADGHFAKYIVTVVDKDVGAFVECKACEVGWEDYWEFPEWKERHSDSEVIHVAEG